MNTKNKSVSVPDMGGLLGKITDKQERGELGTTIKQRVEPANANEQLNNKTIKQKNNKSLKSDKKVGRPSIKLEDVEYVRIGAKIPLLLKKQAQSAAVDEIFKDQDGNALCTIDELVTLALTRLLTKK